MWNPNSFYLTQIPPSGPSTIAIAIAAVVAVLATATATASAAAAASATAAAASATSAPAATTSAVLDAPPCCFLLIVVFPYAMHIFNISSANPIQVYRSFY